MDGERLCVPGRLMDGIAGHDASRLHLVYHEQYDPAVPAAHVSHEHYGQGPHVDGRPFTVQQGIAVEL